jgi:putative ABC transport system permease protein
MTHLALRNLAQQRFRLALSIAGVALAVMLIVLLNGFLAGVYRQVTAYLDHMAPDLVVAEDGVINLLGATSRLAQGTESRAHGIAGIARVIPIVSQFIILDIHDKKVVAYLVGYDEDSGGGPWVVREGRLPEDDDEVVLDWVMATTHGFALGDTLEILDEEFTVVGLSDGTNSWMASFLFVEKRAAERLLFGANGSSFLLIDLSAGADAQAVEMRLRRRLRDTEILPTATVRQNDLNLLVKVFALPLRLMVSIAFAVGTAILGMVIYSATAERMREYGVLKAVGVQNRLLYALVLQQGLAIGLGGVLVGIGSAWLAAQWIMVASPKFLILLESSDVLATGLSGLVMGALASFLPARHVAGLDPAQVFRR